MAFFNVWAKIFKVWLNRRQLDAHVCFCICSVAKCCVAWGRYEVGKGRSIKVAFSENLAIPQYYTGQMVVKSYTVVLIPSVLNGSSTRLGFVASCIGHELVAWKFSVHGTHCSSNTEIFHYRISKSHISWCYHQSHEKVFRNRDTVKLRKANTNFPKF